MKPVHPIVLIILDGFGYSPKRDYNAIAQAHTPHLDYLRATYPHTVLEASGPAVGLPPGMIGNSEVGHLTIGAGEIIKQPETVINHEIADGSLFKNPVLVRNLQKIAATKKTLHIMGLLSDAGVHSDIKHLFALCTAAHEQNVARIIVHPFLDGRDVSPHSAERYMQELEQFIEQYPEISIGSIHGRYYAMDRDHHYDRTKKSYEVLTQPQEHIASSWRDALAQTYAQGISEEFLIPVQLDRSALVYDGDGIIFFNYRPDRARQLTTCFVEQPFSELVSAKNISLDFFITPVSYGSNIDTQALLPNPAIKETLKDALAKKHKTMFSIAETEKYAHVTYFFNGQREAIEPGEERMLIHSLPVERYSQAPQMSAALITQAVLNSLAHNPKDFYLINYANADMVGHSGDLHATIQAVEYLDKQIGELYAAISKMGGVMIITADHGKAEDMYDAATNQPRTAHTTNPVPLIVTKKDMNLSSIKGLSDIKNLVLRLES